MKVSMKMEKVTKNTVRFVEEVASETDAPAIGTIYVPKATLSAIKWKEGMPLYVDVSIQKPTTKKSSGAGQVRGKNEKV